MKALALPLLLAISAGAQAAPDLFAPMTDIRQGTIVRIHRNLRIPADRDIVYFVNGDVRVQLAGGFHTPEFNTVAACWINVTRRSVERTIVAGQPFWVRQARVTTPVTMGILDMEGNLEIASIGCKHAGERPTTVPNVGMMQVHMATFVRLE